MSKQKKKIQTKRREEKKSRKIKKRKQQKGRRFLSKITSENESPFISISPKKLSERILEYAEPLIDAAHGEKEEEKAIRLGVILWNTSLMPKQEALEVLDPILTKMVEDDLALKEEMLDLFEVMYIRKQTLFEKDKRLVVNYSLKETEQGFYLEVASTPFPPLQ